MQQTLTLLTGDSKERENKGGGWETKSEGKGGELRRGCATSTPDVGPEQRGDNFCAVSFVFPFGFPLPRFASCLAYLAVSFAP